jgi:hypothetical protein
MQTAMHEILFHEGWTQEEAEIYCEQGGATRLFSLIFDNFYSLLLHITGKPYKLLEQWDHAKKLRLIWKYALRRSQMIFQNYIYLRNTRSSGYQSTKLIAKLTEELQDAVFTEDTTVPPVTGGASRTKPEWACSHYHGDFHAGGPDHCDLVTSKTKDARRMAKDVTQHLKAREADVLAKVIAETAK